MNSTDVRMCPECLLDKPRAGGFFRNGANADGFDRVCKECMKLRFRIPSTVKFIGPGFDRRQRNDRRRDNVRDGTEGALVTQLLYVFRQIDDMRRGRAVG